MTQELDLNVEDRIQWLMLQPEKRRTEANPWMQLSKHLEGKGNRKGAKQVVYKYRCLLATEREFSPWLWLLKLLSRLKSVVICVFRPVTTFRRVWPYLRHPNRSWHIAFAWLEEVPLRICYSIAFTMMLGTAIFAGAVRSGAMMETVRILPTAVLPNGELRPVSAHYPPFQPFVYTLDNAVPLVKLGMDERWMLNPKHMPQPWFPQVGWLDGLKWLNSYSFLVWSRWGLIVWGWMQATILAASVADRFRK